jgi:large conductance mechanosensitive channel
MSGFKDFIAKGNVLDLAVAVIIGAAFAKIVTSLTEDIIMPVVGALFGGLDFSSHYVLLKPVPATYHGPMTYQGLKAAGVPILGYGAFVSAAVSFLILAYIIYMLVRFATRLMPPKLEVEAGPTDEVILLREIRDELRGRDQTSR